MRNESCDRDGHYLYRISAVIGTNQFSEDDPQNLYYTNQLLNVSETQTRIEPCLTIFISVIMLATRENLDTSFWSLSSDQTASSGSSAA